MTVGTWKLTLLKLPACPAELLASDLAGEPEAGLAAQPATTGTTTRVRTIRRVILLTLALIIQRSPVLELKVTSYIGAMDLEPTS